MPFRCPQCFAPGSLEIMLSLQLLPDNRSDDIMVQLVKCGQCGFQGAAVYEESRRGAMDSDAWEHTGYYLEEPGLSQLLGWLEACPERMNASCTCPGHMALSQRDLYGRWLGIQGLELGKSFSMRLDL